MLGRRRGLVHAFLIHIPMTACFLNREVRWHAWEDGVVLFSPRAAQTVLLPVDAEPLLRHAASADGWRCEVADEAMPDVLALADALRRLAAIRIRD
jgi:hypothetical protein